MAPRHVATEIGYPAGRRVFADDALGYQWRQNGMLLGGATNPTWTVNNAQPTHDGDYDVVISNALGVTTSASVTFSVVPEPAALVLALLLVLGCLELPGVPPWRGSRQRRMRA